MTNNTEQQAVPVAQEDRNFAADYGIRFGRFGELYRRAIEDGQWDHTDDVQLVARHRLASVSSASAETDFRTFFYEGQTGRENLSPEPVPATNQAGEVGRLRMALSLALPWLSQPLDDRDQSASGVAYRAVAAALATQPATSQEGEGTGWVAWNPDSGEEYTPNHPVESGECVEAERIRRSTPQEDTLWQGMQDHFIRAEALVASLAATLSEDLRAKCSICAGNSFVAVDVMQFDQTFAPGPERRCVECKTTFTAQAFAALAATPTPPTATSQEGNKSFASWSTETLAQQCRMQGGDQLDPEFSGFLAEVADRLAALATQPATSQEGEAPVVWRWRFKESAIKGDFWKYTNEWPLKGAPETIDWDRCEKIVEPLYAATPTPPTLSEDLREDTLAMLDQEVSLWPLGSQMRTAAERCRNIARAALAQVKA